MPPRPVKRPRPRRVLRQVAALPWRRRAGDIEVLLVTTRGSGRLIVPKGWPMRARADFRAAAIEAREEAGVAGTVSARPCGSFLYRKRIRGRAVPMRAEVFPLEITDPAAPWKEEAERLRVWLPRAAAAEAVREPGLARLIREFDPPPAETG